MTFIPTNPSLFTKTKTACFVFFITFILVSFSTVYAQKEARICPDELDPKAIDLYKKGTDKKIDKPKRMAFLKEAIEAEPTFASAHYELGVEALKKALARGTYSADIEKHFNAVIANCPDFHADVYYNLGDIALLRKEYAEAVKHFKAFIDFKSEDEFAYPKDYDEKLADVKKRYEYANFFHTQFTNPMPFNPVKLEPVSTKNADEYLPLITPDNDYMFFTRRSEKVELVKDSYIQSDKQSFVEFFTQAKFENNKFDAGHPLPPPFNVDENLNYGGATISLDNRTIILTICKVVSNGYRNCDLYSSEYVYAFNEQANKEMWYWTEPTSLGSGVNTPDGWESQPSLSADGHTLYFATSRKDSRGIDIFKSEKLTNGKWGPAVDVGAPINTDKNDKAPFIHSDSQTLYFASDGHLGLGGYDIFYVRADDKGNWKKPVNIGYPINNEEDQHGFIVGTDGKSVYYSSMDNKKRLDIYTFELYKEARPEKVLFVKGKVEAEGNIPLKDAKIELKNAGNNQIAEFKVSETDGNFAAVITVKDTEEVVMNIKGEDIAFNSRLLKADDDNPVVETAPIEVSKLETGKAFTINDIYFATNSAEITDKSKRILDEFVDFLKENERIKIAIHGHTDDVGDDRDNLVLSTDRAYSVTAFLQEKGISKERLSFKGFGESKPIADNKTDAGRAKNRRTEFIILSGL